MNDSKAAVDKILVGTGAATVSVSASLDTAGYDHASIRVLVNARVNSSAETMSISVLESDDTVVTNHVTITANKTPTPAAAATEQRYELDLRKRKRYLRLVLTPGTHTSNDYQGAVAIVTLSRPERAPTAESELVGSGSTVTVV